MNITIKFVPIAQQAAQGLWEQPVLLAAIITFTGVLLTVVIGTVANFKLAARRNRFEQDLARQRFEFEKAAAADKLKSEAEARNEAQASTLRLRNLEFERECLLKLQESMHALFVNISHIHTAKEKFHNLNNTLSNYELPEDLLESSRSDFALTAQLIARTGRDAIRAAAQEVKAEAVTVKLVESSWEEVDSSYRSASAKARQLNDMIGACLRKLDQDELKEITPEVS